MMVATFYNHYSAMLFKRKFGTGCKLRPVPRHLSSSCGTCAEFSYEETVEEILPLFDENLEAIYQEVEGEYRKVYGD